MHFPAIIKSVFAAVGMTMLLFPCMRGAAQELTGSGGSLGSAGYAADPAWRGWGDTQAYSVRPAARVEPHALPDVPVSTGAGSQDPIERMIARDGSPYAALMPGVPLPGAESGDGTQSAESAQAVGYVPEQYSWDYIRHATRRSAGVSRWSPGLLGGIDLQRATMPGGVGLPWSVGASSWSLTGASGPAVSVGSQDIGLPIWARGAKLGGVNVSDASLPGPGVDHKWNYSVAVGAIDGAPAQSQGDLAYGAGAGYAMLDYGISPAVSLQSQMEVAPSLVSAGLGGEFQTDWGAWTAGISRATGGLYKGWRYQAGYSVNVMDDITLGWLNESSTAGFTDLSTYESGPSTGGVIRQKWSATVPTGRWGDISGSFETVRPASGAASRHFGLTQAFWYSPNLKIGLDARREIVTGDYDVGISFSVPVF